MRLGWIGCHQEGLPALHGVLESGVPVEGVISLTREVAATRSGAADYTALCQRYNIPLYQVASINDVEARELLRRLALDVVFVIGWSQILRPETLALARVGMIGAHASLLPQNRGSAPINWALIRGECVGGNSLLWLAESVDAGAVIDQTQFPITPYDTSASLYDRVAVSNRDMILRLLPRLLRGERPGTPQPRADAGVLPRRRWPHHVGPGCSGSLQLCPRPDQTISRRLWLARRPPLARVARRPPPRQRHLLRAAR